MNQHSDLIIKMVEVQKLKWPSIAEHFSIRHGINYQPNSYLRHYNKVKEQIASSSPFYSPMITSLWSVDGLEGVF